MRRKERRTLWERLRSKNRLIKIEISHELSKKNGFRNSIESDSKSKLYRRKWCDERCLRLSLKLKQLKLKDENLERSILRNFKSESRVYFENMLSFEKHRKMKLVLSSMNIRISFEQGKKGWFNRKKKRLNDWEKCSNNSI